TAVFHFRHVRTQRSFVFSRRPWRDFWAVSVAEWSACTLSAWWISTRARVNPPEMFALAFGCATVARYVLRKGLLRDVRGLRVDQRALELKHLAEGDRR